MTRRTLSCFAAAVAVAVAGCGGDERSAQDVLADTASNLGEIESGTLSFRLVVEPRAGRARDEFGFELNGPFSLSESGALPVARIAYTQIANGKRATATLISTGRKAYVQTGGRTYELPPAQSAQLRTAAGSLQSGGLEELRVEDWIIDPVLSDGGDVGGTDTDRVRARVNVVNAANDLLELAGSFGQGNVPSLRGATAEQLRRAARATRLELYSGKEDRLLRRLAVEVDFGLDVPRELRRALGSLVAARIDFELRIDRPNSAVSVAEPKNALPYAELRGKP